MNLADQLQADINFNKIVSKLRQDLTTKDTSFISSYLAKGNIQRLKDEGFSVNNEGEWRNGGIYVSFKPKNQWADR